MGLGNIETKVLVFCENKWVRWDWYLLKDDGLKEGIDQVELGYLNLISTRSEQVTVTLSLNWMSALRMPPRIPSNLKLDPPVYEEDIGDLSPYLALPSSTSSRTSSTTINSSIDDESDNGLSAGTPREQSFGFHLTASSSSHSSETSYHPPVAQSMSEHSSPRPLRNEINALQVDPASIAKIRRWILGLAVGKSIFHPLCTW